MIKFNDYSFSEPTALPPSSAFMETIAGQPGYTLSSALIQPARRAPTGRCILGIGQHSRPRCRNP